MNRYFQGKGLLIMVSPDGKYRDIGVADMLLSNDFEEVVIDGEFKGGSITGNFEQDNKQIRELMDIFDATPQGRQFREYGNTICHPRVGKGERKRNKKERWR